MKQSTKILLLLVVAMLAASPAMAAKKVRWKMAMTWSSTLAPLADSAQKMAKMVSEMTDGNFEIRVEGAEKHKAPLGILDMVKGGQYEMGHTASYYWKGKDATSVFFTTTPFGMTAAEQYAWFFYDEGMELQQKTYDKFGVYSFPGGNTGVQMGGWFRKEIKSLDDLKGLKMRIPGLAGEVFAKLGVNVTNIAPGELYTSLDRGTIDALEWVGPGMDIKMGFHKIAPYYYAGWHEPASDMQYLINKRAFDKLPANYKAILKTAIMASTFDLCNELFDSSARAWAKMSAEYPNIKVKVFPEEVLKAMRAATVEVMEEYAAKNPDFKRVYESQKAYMKKARKWSTMSTKYYLETSELVGVGK
ncbi:MAG: ABC transporter substrate-binding protein [Deltaproteobacteria bacterium]|nr:MAG: ABC transporter substrate-binding protein [Deltaproteobacteria bacterium]